MAGEEAAIYGLLSATAAITAIVGTRIYPVQCPEEATYPALRYAVVSIEQPSAMSGDPAVRGVHVQCDAIAPTHAQATALRDAVRTLVRTRGAAGSMTAQDVFEEDVGTVFDQDTQLYLASVDVTLWLEG